MTQIPRGFDKVTKPILGSLDKDKPRISNKRERERDSTKEHPWHHPEHPFPFRNPVSSTNKWNLELHLGRSTIPSQHPKPSTTTTEFLTKLESVYSPSAFEHCDHLSVARFILTDAEEIVRCTSKNDSFTIAEARVDSRICSIGN
jgi:hypothetical protein